MFGLIPLSYRLLAAGLALAALLASAWAWQAGRVSDAEAAGYARGHAETEALRADYTAKALTATQANRQREADMQGRVNTAEERYAQLQTQHAQSLDAHRALLAEHGRLRDDITAYAAGGGGATPDTAAAASGRAETLGQLLADALRVGGACAADAEAQSDAVRALRAAWPDTVSPTAQR